MRKCLHCNKLLVRNEPKEKRAHFLKRKYCNFKCSNADRTRVNTEKRAALDLADRAAPPESAGLTFTRKEILQRAHMTTPQIPISTIDLLLREVEPMISANVRHRLLAPMAEQIRANRT